MNTPELTGDRPSGSRPYKLTHIDQHLLEITMGYFVQPQESASFWTTPPWILISELNPPRMRTGATYDEFFEELESQIAQSDGSGWIDNALGVYRADDETVILFEKAIEALAAQHGWAVDDLRRIVLIHEIGHWVTHKLPMSWSREWLLKPYHATHANVHEGWAELITLWTVRDYLDLEAIRQALLKGLPASSPYRAYEKLPFGNTEGSRGEEHLVTRTLPDLRQLEPGATLEDWMSFFRLDGKEKLKAGPLAELL